MIVKAFDNVHLTEDAVSVTVFELERPDKPADAVVCKIQGERYVYVFLNSKARSRFVDYLIPLMAEAARVFGVHRHHITFWPPILQRGHLAYAAAPEALRKLAEYYQFTIISSDSAATIGAKLQKFLNK